MLDIDLTSPYTRVVLVRTRHTSGKFSGRFVLPPKQRGARTPMSELIRESTQNRETVWKCINKIAPRSGHTLPNALKVNDKDCTSSPDIANAFNQHFISSVDEITSNVPASEPVATNCIRPDNDDPFSFEPVSESLLAMEFRK